MIRHRFATFRFSARHRERTSSRATGSDWLAPLTPPLLLVAALALAPAAFAAPTESRPSSASPATPGARPAAARVLLVSSAQPPSAPLGEPAATAQPPRGTRATANTSATATVSPRAADASVEGGRIRLPDSPANAPLADALKPDLFPDTREREDAPTATPFVESLRGNLPPLSLEDCRVALQRARQKAELSAEPSTELAPDLLPLTEQVLAYVRMLDERHSNLRRYRWQPAGTAKVATDGPDRDDFTFSRPIKDVSALAFHSRDGDVSLEGVAVIGVDGHRAEFGLDPPLVIMSGIPRREVFHLYSRTEVRKVEVRYKALQQDRAPRVSLYLGISDHPDYLKSCIYYLERARQTLSGEAAGTSEQLGKVLKLADEQLRQFQRKR